MTEPKAFNRRTLFGFAGAAALLTAVPVLGGNQQPGELLASRRALPAPFQVPLPIPPVLSPGRHPDYPGADYYEITDRVASQEILPGARTTIWGANGTFPGPTIVSYTGRRTVVRRRNALPVPTVNHLHGGHTPSTSDGFPTDLVYPENQPQHHHHMPGMDGDISMGYRDYDYPMDQRAATLWYHDHRMDATGLSVWNGLAGFHLIRDREEAALPLPAGARDIPLMITDRSFDADGSLRYPSKSELMDTYMNGVLGDVILVNGAPWPVAEVAACRYRLRLLNGSNARRYQLAFDPGLPIVQIGSDGGLLDRPRTHETLEMAPAERFDVIVDFSQFRPGQEVTLINLHGSGGTRVIMRFRITGPADDPSRIPAKLAELSTLDRGEAEVVRDFTFQRGADHWTINGQVFDPATPIATPRLGSCEIWRFVTDFHHPVHLHLVPFQVLSRNGEQPGPTDAGWKDTIDLRPAEVAEVIVRFTGYRGRYVLHCHNLEHEDMAMMAVVKVV